MTEPCEGTRTVGLP